MQVVCNYKCAIKLAESERVKKEQKAFKAETVRRKKAILDTDIKHWKKKASVACHEYIRERDKLLPCVSCQRHHTGQYHAGHYRPSGVNSALRYDERNIFKQCSPCNLHKSGNLGEYRRHLISRLGIEVVEWLDNNSEIKKWSIDELKAIEAKYKAKLKALR